MMTKHHSLPSTRVFASLILLFGFAAMLSANLPGHLSYDSVWQLLEGRSERYANWHPAIMSWMLGISDAMFPGTTIFVIFTSAIAFGSLIGILWLKSNVSYFGVLVSLVCIGLPQLFLFQAIVWKDVLFADASLATFVAMAYAANDWKNNAQRYSYLAISTLFIILAVLSRQNGFVVGIFAILALAIIAYRTEGLSKSIAISAAFAAVVVALAFVSYVILQSRSLAKSSVTNQIAHLELYDIAGMLRRDPTLDISIFQTEAPELAQYMRRKATKLYTAASLDPLSGDPTFVSLTETKSEIIGRQWRNIIYSSPLAYLAVRLNDFAWVTLSLHQNQCVTFVVGVNGQSDDLSDLHLNRRYDTRDALLDKRYARRFLGTPIFSHPLYSAGGIICLFFLLRRREPADVAIAGLLVASFAYALTYFFISLACDYRYLYVIDLSTIAAGLYLLKDLYLKGR